MNVVLLSLVLLLAISSLIIKKSVPAMISFVLMMFVLGLYYINLDAKLLGLFQIFIYTGGIMVLMLFGVTIIGLEFPEYKKKPLNAVAALAFFVLITTLFLRGADKLQKVSAKNLQEVNLFSASYSDYLIIFALIGSSLLYATVKMSALLKRKKEVKK